MSAAAAAGRCERARAWAALAPDGELAALEQRLLDTHLGHCAACRAFAADVAGIAEELRAAARERPVRRLRLVLPARRPAHIGFRHVGTAAAVAAMALGIGLRPPVGGVDRPVPPASNVPADVDDAELRTMRLLRREALLNADGGSGYPSGTFGNQPA